MDRLDAPFDKGDSIVTDAMDKAAGLSSNDAIYAARRFRPDFVKGAELCRISVLTPANDLGLPSALRVALACRMAALNRDDALVEQYAAQLADLAPSPQFEALARGSVELEEPLATIARHADMVTSTPKVAEAGDIARLVAAGLSNPQIVALSELIAFVSFQVRVAAGLRLMRASL